MKTKLYCGAALADITPTPDMMPMPRGIRNAFFGGIIDPLKVRAIALGDGENKLLLVSFDLGGAPNPAENIPALSARTGIPEENILFVGTHAHAAPMVGRTGPMGPNAPVASEFAEVSARYSKLVEDAMFDAVDRAAASMRPARVGHANGKSYINVNRNEDYVSIDKDGTRIVRCGVGFNAEGPTDKTLFVMRFDDYDGNPIAFFINYPVHNVVMHANELFDGQMGISSDIGGNVSMFMENHFSGAVAMWTSGAAGDQNPIMMNQCYYPDPVTGAFTAKPTQGAVEMLETLATRHYADVQRTLEKIERTSELCDLSATVGLSYTPGRDVVMPDPNDIFGDVKVEMNENTAPYDVRLHLMKVGDVALLGVSGELYTTLSLHIKDVSPMSDTVIVTHDAGHMSRSGYIYDDDGIAREALHHNRSRILPGYVKESLSKVTLEMFEKLM